MAFGGVGGGLLIGLSVSFCVLISGVGGDDAVSAVAAALMLVVVASVWVGAGAVDLASASGLIAAWGVWAA